MVHKLRFVLQAKLMHTELLLWYYISGVFFKRPDCSLYWLLWQWTITMNITRICQPQASKWVKFILCSKWYLDWIENVLRHFTNVLDITDWVQFYYSLPPWKYQMNQKKIIQSRFLKIYKQTTCVLQDIRTWAQNSKGMI